MLVGKLPIRRNTTEEGIISFLNDVRRYGELLARYDMDTANGPDDTESVFIYNYTPEPTGLHYKVVIVMSKGEYIDYYKHLV